MTNSKVKVTMTFELDLELFPESYPSCISVQDMISEEKKFFSDQKLIINEYLPGAKNLKYNFKIEEKTINGS